MGQEIENVLSESTDSIVAFHCKAGKGRTGTMICCFLLRQICHEGNTTLRDRIDELFLEKYPDSSGHCSNTDCEVWTKNAKFEGGAPATCSLCGSGWVGSSSWAEKVMHYYGDMRTHDGCGVTIPSQRRYICEYEKWLELPLEKRNQERIYKVKAISVQSQGNQFESVEITGASTAKFERTRYQTADAFKDERKPFQEPEFYPHQRKGQSYSTATDYPMKGRTNDTFPDGVELKSTKIDVAECEELSGDFKISFKKLVKDTYLNRLDSLRTGYRKPKKDSIYISNTWRKPCSTSRTTQYFWKDQTPKCVLERIS